MSDKKPNKIVEQSPFEKWWAEVQEWRAGRDKNKTVKRRQKAEQFNETRHLRRKGRTGKKPIIDLFGIFGMMVFGLIEFIFGLIGIALRFAFWIAMVGGVIWLLTTFDVKTVVKDEAVDEVKEQAVETKEKVKGEVGDIFQSIADEINKIKENWSIEIRQTTEDGKEVKVLEFGTKKDEPPETPE